MLEIITKFLSSSKIVDTPPMAPSHCHDALVPKGTDAVFSSKKSTERQTQALEHLQDEGTMLPLLCLHLLGDSNIS